MSLWVWAWLLRGCAVGSEVVVGLVACEHPVGRDQHRVRDGYLGPAHAAPPGQSGVLGGQIVLAPHPADRAGGLDQHRGHHLLPCRFPAGVCLPADSMHRRRQPGPGSQMGRGRKPGHVGAGLGHDDLRDRLPTPGMVCNNSS